MAPSPRRGALARASFSTLIRTSAVLGVVALVGVGFLRAPHASADIDHVVQPGETLADIAAQYGFPVETLMDLNGINDPESLQAGAVIRVPEWLINPGTNFQPTQPPASTEAAAASDDAALQLSAANGAVPVDDQVPFEAQSLQVAAQTSGATHVVQGGETLGEIASLYGVPVADLVNLNGLLVPDFIFVGQILGVPGSFWEGDPTPSASVGAVDYVVQLGDTLNEIAAWFGVTPNAIVEANGIVEIDFLYAGQPLVIPAANRTDFPTPAAGPVRETPTVSDWFNYVVETGDTLGQIAARYGISVDDLVAANGLSNPNAIIAGTQLAIPGSDDSGDASSDSDGGDTTVSLPRTAPEPSVSHKVSAGETLSGIAAIYGVSMQLIIDANELGDGDVIHPGDVLTIPGSAVDTPSEGEVDASGSGLLSHRVVGGESLGGIAALFGISLQELLDLNDLSMDSVIHPGDELLVPRGVTSVQELSKAEYQVILEEAAAEFGVNPALIKAQAWIESGWQQNVQSHADAIGIMQILPTTAEWAQQFLLNGAEEWETDARANARMGVAIMHHWLLQGGWDVELALAAYYQGWEAIFTVGLFEDTKSYIASVLGFVPDFE